MKLKSLKVARNCMSLVLKKNKQSNILTDMIKGAIQDIIHCIIVLNE